MGRYTNDGFLSSKVVFWGAVMRWFHFSLSLSLFFFFFYFSRRGLWERRERRSGWGHVGCWPGSGLTSGGFAW